MAKTTAVARASEVEELRAELARRIDAAGELLRQKSAFEKAYEKERAEVTALMTKLGVPAGERVDATAFYAKVEEQTSRSIDPEALRRRVTAEVFYSCCKVDLTKAEHVLDGATFDKVCTVGTRLQLRIRELNEA